jgi:uncharacterized protein YcbK (DUF882 family)
MRCQCPGRADHEKRVGVGNKRLPLKAGWLLCIKSAAIIMLSTATWLGATQGTQDAIANGDTRTISIYHQHTKETITVTFKRYGSYDSEALKQLNWILRDWRHDEPIKMDPRLFDIAWEVHRESGSSEPFHVVSAYRSPATNSMLRRRSRGVAKHSQHMLGKAMDFHLPDVSMAKVRTIGMRLQRGGVGYYSGAHTPFVHLDAGSVRSWPRMPRDQLARLFPDGRTVHIPADGRPMVGYEMAKADIMSSGGSVMGYASSGGEEEGGSASTTGRRSLWATLFGGGDDEDSDYIAATQKRGARTASRNSPAQTTRAAQAYMASAEGEDGGSRGMLANMMATPGAQFSEQPASRPASRSRSSRGETQVASLVPATPAATEIAIAEPAPPKPVEPKALAAKPAEPEPTVLASVPLPVARPVMAEMAETAPQTTSVMPPSRLALLNEPPAQPDMVWKQGPDAIKPAEETAPNAKTPAHEPQLVSVRLPPSRPGSQQVEPSVQLASMSAPADVTASLPPRNASPKSAAVKDERSALKALFAAVSSGTDAPKTSKVAMARTRVQSLPDAVSVSTPPSIVTRFTSGSAAPRADRFVKAGRS